VLDKVFIHGLELEATIGVYEWERDILQRLVVDLEMGSNIQPAAKQDDIHLSLDYFVISEQIKRWVNDSRFQLIESLAEDLATKLRETFHIPWLRLRLHKPGAVPDARSVGVEIERGELF
jgi:dihydroneopterin aldolase